MACLTKVLGLSRLWYTEIRTEIVSNFCSSEHFTVIAKAYVQLLPEDLWLRNVFSTVSDLCMISTRTFIFENVLKSMLKVIYGIF